VSTSKIQSQPELNDSWVYRRIRDGPEGPCSHVAIWKTEIRVIEKVIEIGSKSQIKSLTYLKVFHQGEIDLLLTIGTQ
jgi:hypothetical protein